MNCQITIFEISEGDLLIEKVRKYPAETNAIIIVLSNESAASDWCQKRLTEGLLHEIEGNGTAVIHLLIEDCNLPEFAQSAPVADFRNCSIEDMSRIAQLVVWTSTWRKEISDYRNQELQSGKSPDDCQIKRIKLPFKRQRIGSGNDCTLWISFGAKCS
ncbi:MAG: hypothetical protein PHD65_06290 [Gallionella sp.]|nr:hypothetical protein [Gallionella sp.]